MSIISNIRRETRDCETRDWFLSLSKDPCPEVPRPVSKQYVILFEQLLNH